MIEKIFRANPRYRPVLFDRLADQDRSTLAAMLGDGRFYGILHGGDDEMLGVKSIDRETALLFFTMREPGRLPGYVLRELGSQLGAVVARLVTDQILEVLDGERFVTGPAAASLLHSGADYVPRSRVGRLSIEALQYAERLSCDSVNQLAGRLYTFNTVPHSPQWRRTLPTAEAASRFLKIGEDPLRRLLARRWTTSSRQEWLSWSRDKGPPIPAGRTFKLYVSPLAEAIPGSFEAIVDAMSASPVWQFKVGADRWGLLRPDKIVAYCVSYDDLAATAERLEQRLGGIPAQGVPFTAAIDAPGLLSWGVDAAGERRQRTLTGSDSWRSALAHRLARSIWVARSAAGTERAPWLLALDRLRLDGVDPQQWMPFDVLDDSRH